MTRIQIPARAGFLIFVTMSRLALLSI